MSNSNSVVDQQPAALPIQSPAPEKKKRGFASMNRDQVRELARKGGVAAHRAGTAHEFSSDEAREAGRKGGLAAHATGKKVEPIEPLPNPSN
jgi:general stress protein YciG